jgi:hypothetical protein
MTIQEGKEKSMMPILRLILPCRSRKLVRTRKRSPCQLWSSYRQERAPTMGEVL